MSSNEATLYLGSLPHLTLEDIIALSECLMGRPATPKEVEEARKAFSEPLGKHARF